MNRTMYGLIYLITNTVTGRLYVGQTIGTLSTRWTQHKCVALTNPRQTISKAIRKYGPENFTINQICKAESKEELDRLEKLSIVLMDSLRPNGYNMTTGGSGYMEHSEETRLKMAQSQTGRKHTAETRLKISENQKGKVISQAHREAVSRAQKGREMSKEFCARRSQIMTEHNPFKGKQHSEEARKRMSDAKKGKVPRTVTTDETREKLRIAGMNRTASEESKGKMRAHWTPERKAAASLARAEWWAAKRQNVV